MSSDAKVKCGSHGVSLRFWISSLVFLTLKAFGIGAMWLILFVNSLDSYNTNPKYKIFYLKTTSKRPPPTQPKHSKHKSERL